MALNVVIDLPCGPKQSLDPDADIGTRALLGLLRARDHAEAVRQSAERSGRDPATMAVTLATVQGDGNRTERQVKLAELDAEAGRLNAFAVDCVTCPVNDGGRPGGCAGSVHYPIRRAAEAWLLSRVQHPDTVGGFLLLKAIEDFQYDGSVVRGFRARGLFEASEPLSRPLPPNPFDMATVDTDQLFHAVLGVGPKLNPWHLGMFLCWFGALAVDGYVPTTPTQFEMLIEMKESDRPKRARPNLGDPSENPDERAMQALLYRMAVAWAHDQALVVDA